MIRNIFLSRLDFVDEVLDYSNASENVGEKKKTTVEELFVRVRTSKGLAES